MTELEKKIADQAAKLNRQITTDKKAIFAEGVKTRDGFDNFASRLGLNNNNSLSFGGYTFNLISRNRLLLEAAYRGSWIVGQVVDAVAEDMTKAGVMITTAKGDANIKKLKSAGSRLQIAQSFCNLIRWGRLYGGAIAVVQIKGQDPESPLDLDTIAKDQFEGMVIFDRWQVNPVLQLLIDSGPEIGLPKYYDIVNDPREQEPNFNTATGQMRVHHSRCIRNIGIQLPYFQAITEMLWGESKLERLWDRLIAFDSASMSTANLIERANNRTVQIEGLREIISNGGEAYEGLLKMMDLMREMQTNEGLTLLDKNDMFTSTAYSFAGLSDVLIQFGQQLSGASGIPLVRLFGQSPAGLSATGESDMRMYYDNINAQQESSLRNAWEMIIKIMWRSTFGEEAPDDLEFIFAPLWQMSASDKANNAKTIAETIIGAFEAGLAPRDVAMKELRHASADTGLFSSITDEDIKDAENEEPPMPDEPGQDPSEPPSAEPQKADAGNPAGAPPPKIKTPIPSLDSKTNESWKFWNRGK